MAEKLEVTSPNDVVLVTTAAMPPYRAHEVFHVSKEHADQLKAAHAPVENYSAGKHKDLLPENQDSPSGATDEFVEGILRAYPIQNVTTASGQSKPVSAQLTRQGDTAELDQNSQQTHSDVAAVGDKGVAITGRDVVNPDGSVTRNGQEVAPANPNAVNLPSVPTDVGSGQPVAADSSSSSDSGSSSSSNSSNSGSSSSSSNSTPAPGGAGQAAS